MNKGYIQTQSVDSIYILPAVDDRKINKNTL